MVESTALGAAILAAVGAGLMEVSEVESSQGNEFVPSIGEDGKFFGYCCIVKIRKGKKKLVLFSERDLRYSKWKMAVERSMKWDCTTSLAD